MKTPVITFALALFMVSIASAQNSNKSFGDYYQISIYHTDSQAQTDSLSHYFESSYIPALHKAGFDKVGVFMPLTNDTSADKRIVVWIPMKSLNNLQKIGLFNDCPKYKRLENIILTAFEQAPHYKVPSLNGNPADHIYELRSYEGPTEERYLQKVKMFNAGDEVGLFARLGFNAVFYAQVLAGSRMPNLMYMISFENKASHDAHWKSFGDDAYWKKLSALTEYQNTVSKIDAVFMRPAGYSDLK
ncbi:NIPSNAP family protein [Mucilaginibacter agri]|uniref:NIPSNAP family containing protein n=1 Tax=Mucilaginibacter agri TaxID=2695265 RepID=A0A965ZET4_9SPHI|nr:NIPSNAP family protein [Mucilaginibacter agri]NCD68742.1 NIPSNAP family containing protein [Mucilaginibacter agri]